jgi:hypothetical protein
MEGWSVPSPPDRSRRLSYLSLGVSDSPDEMVTDVIGLLYLSHMRTPTHGANSLYRYCAVGWVYEYVSMAPRFQTPHV